MKRIIKKEGGFTLIEVVLVLAIGALIILLALLAFGGAQRARRDTARANLAGTVVSGVEQYASNNDGTAPTGPQFNTLANSSNWKNPGNNAVIQYSNNDPSTKGTIVFRTVACDGGTGYSVRYVQESGTGAVVCKDGK